MLSHKLVLTLAEARRRIPPQDWDRLTAQAAQMDGCPDPKSISRLTSTLINRDAGWLLRDALEKCTTVRWEIIATSMLTIALINDHPSSDIIWTGPANNRFPVRRIDQVLYDLITAAQRNILLVTFAAHKIQRLCTHLSAAVARGVELTLVVESEDESEGQLSIDALAAFQNIPLGNARIYYWPLEQRERNDAGRPGKLHAKCAIVDDTAILGSANFTDDAFNRNIELGAMIRDPLFVQTLHLHFQELIIHGILKSVVAPSR